MYFVYVEVISLAGKWQNMCLSLRLRPSDEIMIAKMYTGPIDCLRAVLTKWLRKGYNYQKHGPPTWRMLVKAVADPAGGDNVALAEVIARNHQGDHSF